jgi:hypothetical protein
VTEEKTTEVEIGADGSIDADKSYVLSERITRDVLTEIDVILSRTVVASTSTLLNVDRDVDEIRSSVCTVEDVVAMLVLLLCGRHGPALTSQQSATVTVK